MNKENGYLDEAIADFDARARRRTRRSRARGGFDFSHDYEVINELGQTLFERAQAGARAAARERRAECPANGPPQQFERTLALDSENVTAHYGLSLIYAQLGDATKRRRARRAARALQARRQRRAIARSRSPGANPAADHAAEAIVIYPLR